MTQITAQDLIQQQQAINEQAAAIAAQIKQLQDAEKAAAIDQIRQLMESNAITIKDLREQKIQAHKDNGTQIPKKVQAKYRDSVTGKEWSGRGIRPNWVTDEMLIV